MNKFPDPDLSHCLCLGTQTITIKNVQKRAVNKYAINGILFEIKTSPYWFLSTRWKLEAIMESKFFAEIETVGDGEYFSVKIEENFREGTDIDRANFQKVNLLTC